MTRRRYRQDPVTFELVEVTEDREPDRHVGDAALWGDRGYDGMRTTDGVDISSRSKHRSYMQAHGLTTADDFKGEFARRQVERDDYHRSGGSVSRDDIRRAMYEMQNK